MNSIQEIIIYIAKDIMLLIWVLFLFIWISKIYKYNLKEHTLKNKDWNIIIFQEMIHLGLPSFYKNVKEWLESYKEQGYKIYYEQVWVWENEKDKELYSQELDKIIGMKIGKDSYKNLADIYWLEVQRNDDLLSNVPKDRIINADVSTKEIITEYISKFWEDYKSKSPKNKSDLLIKSSEFVKKQSSFIRTSLQSIGKIFLISLLKSKPQIDDYMRNKGSKFQEIKEIVLDYRNKIIIDRFIYKDNSLQDSKIYILYWAAHFEWVLDLLKEKDSSWELISSKETRAL